MTLIINEMGEFVDEFDPNPDEQRQKAYSSLRKIKPERLAIDDRRKERTRSRRHRR